MPQSAIVTFTLGVPSAEAASASAQRMSHMANQQERSMHLGWPNWLALWIQTYPSEDVKALCDAPKDHVLAVALRRRRQREEELRGVAAQWHSCRLSLLILWSMDADGCPAAKGTPVLPRVGHAEHPGCIMLQLQPSFLVVEFATVDAVPAGAITCSSTLTCKATASQVPALVRGAACMHLARCLRPDSRSPAQSCGTCTPAHCSILSVMSPACHEKVSCRKGNHLEMEGLL